jgi:hypothetical protein
MAPKHGIGASQVEETLAKRVKNSSTPASRSTTPAVITSRVPFSVQYPPTSTKRRLNEKDQELVDHAEFQTSPFVAKGASNKGELDQYYTVTPSDEWESMKKYANFISEQNTIPYFGPWLLTNISQSGVRYTRIITSSMCEDKTPLRGT